MHRSRTNQLSNPLHPVEHCDWRKIEPWTVVNKISKERVRNNEPRRRVELMDDAPADVRKTALAMILPCWCCGRSLRVFRERLGRGRAGGGINRIFASGFCGKAVSARCSNGPKTTSWFEQFKPGGQRPERQLTLLGGLLL